MWPRCAPLSGVASDVFARATPQLDLGATDEPVAGASAEYATAGHPNAGRAGTGSVGAEKSSSALGHGWSGVQLAGALVKGLYGAIEGAAGTRR
jgi:hypothetical protein